MQDSGNPLIISRVKELLATLAWSRALAVVLLANVLSLAILNALHLRPADLLWIYPLGLVSGGVLFARARVRRKPVRLYKFTLLWAAIFLAFLTVPRIPYSLEWIPGNSVLAQADDYGRLAELVSMTLSDRYPLQHPSNQSFLLSHYYAALYPMAFLKVLLPVLTLKDSIVLGNLLYHVLLVFSFAELAARWMPSARAYVVFLFLCSFFGGFDWLLYPRLLFGHSEHWPRDVFHRIREVSSFYTGMFWVIHHFVGFYAVLLALLFAAHLRFQERWRKPLLFGLLLIGALYSSVFATFTIALLAPMQLLLLARRLLRFPAVLTLLAVAFAVPLFLYTNRVQSASFAWNPSLLYLPLSLVIDFAGIPILLFAIRHRFNFRERYLFWTSLAFFASTGFVESIGYNNYSMRGMFLPTMVFWYLTGRYLSHMRARGYLAVVLIAGSIGVVKEAAHLTYQPLLFSSWYWKQQGKSPPEFVLRQLRPAYRDSARDRSIRYYQPDAGDRLDLSKFNAEKMVHLDVAEMPGAEYELLRRPKQNWFW